MVVQRPDGRRVPLVTRAAPVNLGGPGREPAAVWVIEDLTALHQAEARRRDSERRLRAVVEGMVEGLVILDRRGLVVVDCNPTACALFGEAAERLRGRPLDGLPWTCLGEDGVPLPADARPWQVARKTGQPVRNFLLGLAPATPSGDDNVVGAPSRGAPALGPARLAGPTGAPAVRWVLVNALPT